MSADNWGMCPKCQFDLDEDVVTPTLREDYEMGITQDGEYYCYYTGACAECGFRFDFNKKERVYIG